MPDIMEKQISSYLKYLPVTFQDENGFVDNFLKAFDELLTQSHAPLTAATVNGEDREFVIWGGVYNYDGFTTYINDQLIILLEKKLVTREHSDITSLRDLIRRYFNQNDNIEKLLVIVNMFFDQDGQPRLQVNINELAPLLGDYLVCSVVRNTVPQEEIIGTFHKYFDPGYTPAQFLDWIASWFGVKLKTGEDYNHELDILEREDNKGQIPPLSVSRSSYNRSLLGNIFNLYQKKSTETGLKEFLDFYITNTSYYIYLSPDQGKARVSIANYVSYEIDEYLYPFIIKDQNPELKELEMANADQGLPMVVDAFYNGLIVGRSTVVNERSPFFFKVKITVRHSNIELIDKIKSDIIQLLNEQKPAHTHYALVFEVTDAILGGDSSRNILFVGYNTFVGGLWQVI